MSAGDQVPYIVPEENLVTLLETARKYDRYPLDLNLLR